MLHFTGNQQIFSKKQTNKKHTPKNTQNKKQTINSALFETRRDFVLLPNPRSLFIHVDTTCSQSPQSAALPAAKLRPKLPKSNKGCLVKAPSSAPITLDSLMGASNQSRGSPRKKNKTKKGYHEPPGHPLDWLLAPIKGNRRTVSSFDKAALVGFWEFWLQLGSRQGSRLWTLRASGINMYKQAAGIREKHDKVSPSFKQCTVYCLLFVFCFAYCFLLFFWCVFCLFFCFVCFLILTNFPFSNDWRSLDVINIAPKWANLAPRWANIIQKWAGVDGRAPPGACGWSWFNIRKLRRAQGCCGHSETACQWRPDGAFGLRRA